MEFIVAGPLIIAVCVGVITCIIVGVVSYYVGRHLHYVESSQQKLLGEEFIKREKEVRQSASTLAQQTAEDVKELVQQSKEQQAHMATNTQKLGEKVGEIEVIAMKLEETSVELIDVSEGVKDKVDAITKELNQLKAEIILVNQQLKLAKESLTEKEMTLQEVVALLSNTQKSLAENTQKSKKEVEALTKQLVETQQLIIANLSPTDSIKEMEIIHLRADNERLASTIQKLENTLNHYKTTLKSLSHTNKKQLEEISILHRENKELTQAIKSISDALEETQETQDSSRATSTSHNNLGLFK